eukprot:g5085.t1
MVLWCYLDYYTITEEKTNMDFIKKLFSTSTNTPSESTPESNVSVECFQFDPEISKLTAEKKSKFEESATFGSPVTLIPSIGKKSAESLEEKGIKTIGDLVEKIDSFDKLKKTLPSGLKSHQIFDALEIFLKDKCPSEYKVKKEKDADSVTVQRNLEEAFNTVSDKEKNSKENSTDNNEEIMVKEDLALLAKSNTTNSLKAEGEDGNGPVLSNSKNQTDSLIDSFNNINLKAESEKLAAHDGKELSVAPTPGKTLKINVPPEKTSTDEEKNQVRKMRTLSEVSSPGSDIKRGKLRKVRFHRDVWGHDGYISYEQVKQGKWNNCYLACGLMMVAAHYKEELKEAIKEVPSEQWNEEDVREFDVSFKERRGRGRNAEITTETVRINEKFYSSGATPYFMDSPKCEDDQCLWPMILEKALVIYNFNHNRCIKGTGADEISYDAVDANKVDAMANNAAYVVEAVTGKTCIVNSDGFDDAWMKIKRAHENGHSCCCGSEAYSQGYSRPTVTKSEWVVGNHQYLVTAACIEGDEKVLKLKNPQNRFCKEEGRRCENELTIMRADWTKLFKTFSYMED